MAKKVTRRKSASQKKTGKKKKKQSGATVRKAKPKKSASSSLKVRGKPARKKAAATNKTVPVSKSPEAVIAAARTEQKQADCRELLETMRTITGQPAVVWGGSIIGFGRYHYKYESGRVGDSFLTGFAPRAQNLVVYIMPGFANQPDLMNRLGKYKTGKSCLYLNRLSDVNPNVLRELIAQSVAYMRSKYECT